MKNIVRIFNNLDVVDLKNDGDKAILEGFAAHYGDANLNMERVDADSFTKFFEMYNSKKLKPYLNYNHDSDKQVGGIDELESRNEGLYIKAHLNTRLPFVSDWIIPLIEGGDLKSFSTEGWAYDVTYLDDETYYVGQFMLTAVALVQTPADYKSEFKLANLYNATKAKQDIEKTRWYLL